VPNRAKRRRKSKDAKARYILNYTIGNVSRRTGETRDDVRVWLLTSLSTSIRCPFCQESLVLGKNVAVDHMEPLARGGSPRLTNCWLTCQPCNRAKGDLTVAEFKALRGALTAIGSYALKSVLARLKIAGAMYK